MPASSVAAPDGDDPANGIEPSTETEMIRPLIDTPTPNDIPAKKIKKNFLLMSALFAVNHGCTVSVLGLSNARLGSIGIWQSGVLYASYTAAALFGASYFVQKFGSRNGLVLGMGMSASYVTSFFLATVIVEYNEDLVWLQSAVAIGGAAVGGVGSSILWVSQGTYFSMASQLFASHTGAEEVEQEVIPVEDVTSQFGGNFACIFLLFEVLLRVLSTTLIETVGLSWKAIFGLYSFLSVIPVFFMLGVMDLDRYQNECSSNEDGSSCQNFESENEEDDNSPSPSKAAAAIDLLRNDPKTKYLSLVNILFGLSTAFSSSVLNGEVLEQVLSDPNSTYVGLYTAVISLVAAGASLFFGKLQSSHENVHCGKGVVLTIGALSYLSIAIQFLAFPDGSDWTRATLLMVYVLLGIGRATYEGTLRAVFADLFPNNKEGAFSNIILFSGSASTIGYILSVTSALQCEQASRYCMVYSNGTIHNVLIMEVVIIATAFLAIPSFWRAIWMFRLEQNENVPTNVE